MLVKEKKFQEEDGSIGYYDALYESSNILQTTYFPASNRLYISFQRGGVYSYGNVSEELYEEFKVAESHGKFFHAEIKSQPTKYPARKEFTLYPDEVKELKEMVEHEIKLQEFTEENGLTFQEGALPTPMIGFNTAVEPNNIVFSIENEEVIKINPDGFYWKGKSIKEDTEIYERFKNWVDYAWAQIPQKG